MKEKLIAKNKNQLRRYIEWAIRDNGNECDLNHIDVSNITDMEQLFFRSEFNGNISEWDTSNVTNMCMMFEDSQFDGDISNWDVSKVNNMMAMFSCSKFSGDISNWKPYNLINKGSMFYQSKITKPYWLDLTKVAPGEPRKKAIESYLLHQELSKAIILENTDNKRKSKL
jgi:surface protein